LLFIFLVPTQIILMSATLNANLFLDYFRLAPAAAKGRRAPAVATGVACTLLSIPGAASLITLCGLHWRVDLIAYFSILFVHARPYIPGD